MIGAAFGQEKKETGMALFAKSLFREGASLRCTKFLDALLKDYPGDDFQV